MASTQRTQAKPPSKKSSSKTPVKRTTNSPSKAKSTKSAPPAKKTKATSVWERLSAGMLCFLIAMFLLLNLFGVKALVVDFLGGLFKGVVGYGFFISVPVLLFLSYLYLFRTRERITLRVWLALLLPPLFGALLHVFLDTDLYQLSLPGLQDLYFDGQILHCGGAVGGFLSVLFTQLFSSIGAAVIFLLGLLVCLFGALHITPTAILHALQNLYAHYQESRSYDDDYEAYDDYHHHEDNEYEHEPQYAAPRRRRFFDPMPDKPKDEKPEEAPPQRGFFKKPRVRPPHELLTGETSEEIAPPPVEETPLPPAPEPIPTAPVIPPPSPVMETVLEPVVVPVIKEPVNEPPLPEPTVMAPPTMPNPVEENLSKSEQRERILEEQAMVAKTVAEVLETPPPLVYDYPSVNLLHEATMPSEDSVQEELNAIQKRLSETISSFGIVAKISGAVRGPSVTRYEVELDQGVRLNKLTNLSDDIALALGASSVRIAPVPGKISLVGIEVPNKKITPVPIREVIASPTFSDHKSRVAFSVGKDIGGNYIIGDIAKLPHLLIAGTTGSGKSVCTNSLIISMLYKASPEEVRLIMVDPKMVELGIYNGIPHLLIPVVTDPKKAAGALQWAVTEMMKRYRMFAEVGVRDLASYNALALRTEKPKLPQIVVVIDELADLMLVAAKEVEESICRVAQMGRASGMHLIIATQRPSADVITGLMKANIPSRIAFAVASALESRIILDTQGAEKLVGKGDMLWFPLGSGKPLRVQGCLIDDDDVAAVVAFVKAQGETVYDEEVLQEIEQNAVEHGSKGSKNANASSSDNLSDEDDADRDVHFPQAVEIVLELGQASVSMLQRRLKLGYARAARLVDQMEDQGIVGPFEGSKPRQLLVTREKWEAMQGKSAAPSPEVTAIPAMAPVAPLASMALPEEEELPPLPEEAPNVWEEADDVPPWDDESL